MRSLLRRGLLHTRVVARVAGLTVAALVLSERTQHFIPEAVGRVEEGGFVCIDGGTLPDKVGGVRADHSGALENLPKGESDNSQEL